MSGENGKWRNRIIGSGELPASEFLANPANWRIHPKPQQEALEGALNEIGWIQEVVVNQRSGNMIDGHLRVTLALRHGDDTPVPVKYVDLSPEEEALALATVDPIAAMATADAAKLDDLMRDIQTGEAGLQAMLAGLAEAEIYGRLLTPTEAANDPYAEWEGMPEFEQEDKTAYKTLHIHFKDQSAIDQFAELVGQKITERTRFLWYPEIEIETYADKRYIDEP